MTILSDNRLILAVLLFLFGCSTEKPESFEFNGGTIGLKRVNDSLSYIFHTKNDEVISYWKLPYPVYRFDYGDLNGDSVPELAVGVTKPTLSSPVMANRLFLFKLYDKELIKPLWFGSRVTYKLIDFKVRQDTFPATIVTEELSPHGKTFEAEYKTHKGFGIERLRLVER
jgi:hypothetical protein